jgi:hypothetical protein
LPAVRACLSPGTPFNAATVSSPWRHFLCATAALPSARQKMPQRPEAQSLADIFASDAIRIAGFPEKTGRNKHFFA